MTLPYLHFVSALHCEAKPIIEHWHLKRCLKFSAFALYEKDRTTLTVTGIGKVSMAAATAYTEAAYGNQEDSVWLNIGIAGHNSRRVGQLCIASKIIDEDSGKRWYPPILIRRSFPSSILATVSRQETRYEKDYVYDMEASGFYSTAIRFSTSELVQCLKVVADNDVESRQAINPAKVSDLMSNCLPDIVAVSDQLNNMAQSVTIDQPRFFSELAENWHFTEHQKLRLRHALRQWEIVSPHEVLNLKELEPISTGKEVLGWLNNRLDQMPTAL